MKMTDLIQACKDSCPDSVSWMVRELYGDFNIGDYMRDVKKVLYCVTPTKEVVDYFREHKYDLLISHHPFVVDVPQLIFHTALDCCDGGLNDQWRDHLGILPPYQHFDGTLGWYGRIKPTPFLELCRLVKGLSRSLDGECWSESPDFIVNSVVVCSGLGGMVNDLALATKADCYILGEQTMSARHTGFKSVIETGHTNSEWMGVLLFQRLLTGVQVDLAPKEVDYYGREKRMSRKVG